MLVNTFFPKWLMADTLLNRFIDEFFRPSVIIEDVGKLKISMVHPHMLGIIPPEDKAMFSHIVNQFNQIFFKFINMDFYQYHHEFIDTNTTQKIETEVERKIIISKNFSKFPVKEPKEILKACLGIDSYNGLIKPFYPFNRVQHGIIDNRSMSKIQLQERYGNEIGTWLFNKIQTALKTVNNTIIDKRRVAEVGHRVENIIYEDMKDEGFGDPYDELIKHKNTGREFKIGFNYG